MMITDVHLTRRQLGAGTLKTLLFISLGSLLWNRRALSGPVAGELEQWMRTLHGMAKDLKGENISPMLAQGVVEDFFSQVDVVDLCRFIDFDRLIQGITYPDVGEVTIPIQIPNMIGLPEHLSFKSELVAIQRGRSIPPHGHCNQMTGFLNLGGELHGRHYDRVDDGRDLLLTPTIDRAFDLGSFSTISDVKDNVHWFTTLSDYAFMYNIVVSDLNERPHEGIGRVHLDLRGGEMANGTIRARRIKSKECYAIYG